MVRKILCICFCVVMLCGCSEDYGTQVYSSQTTSQTASEREDFEVLKDIGKEHLMFDNSRVVAAYKSGDDSGLSEFEKEILNIAKDVIDEILRTSTSDYMTELMIHDYIVGSSTYDKQAISALEIPCENSENPYGILVNKTGICLGYTTTFQLFMDMAQIPCVTIYAEGEDGEEHAWNQVEIDGKWYYVDCTWDDPVPEEEGRPPFHSYFNVTEEYMWESGHRWDKELCKKSDSYENSFFVKEACEVSSRKEIKDAMTQAVRDGKGDVVIAVDRDFYDYQGEMTGGGKIFYLSSFIEYDSKNYILYTAY